MPAATSLEANVPVAPAVSSVTTSPLTIPCSAAPAVSSVAAFASYTLFSAVTPETVRVAGLMVNVTDWLSAGA